MLLSLAELRPRGLRLFSRRSLKNIVLCTSVYDHAASIGPKQAAHSARRFLRWRRAFSRGPATIVTCTRLFPFFIRAIEFVSIHLMSHGMIEERTLTPDIDEPATARNGDRRRNRCRPGQENCLDQELVAQDHELKLHRLLALSCLDLRHDVGALPPHFP